VLDLCCELFGSLAQLGGDRRVIGAVLARGGDKCREVAGELLGKVGSTGKRPASSIQSTSFLETSRVFTAAARNPVIVTFGLTFIASNPPASCFRTFVATSLVMMRR